MFGLRTWCTKKPFGYSRTSLLETFKPRVQNDMVVNLITTLKITTKNSFFYELQLLTKLQ